MIYLNAWTSKRNTLRLESRIDTQILGHLTLGSPGRLGIARFSFCRYCPLPEPLEAQILETQCFLVYWCAEHRVIVGNSLLVERKLYVPPSFVTGFNSC